MWGRGGGPPGGLPGSENRGEVVSNRFEVVPITFGRFWRCSKKFFFHGFFQRKMVIARAPKKVIFGPYLGPPLAHFGLKRA